MTTTVTAIQALIDKIAAILANSEFTKDHATQSVLLAEAKLKLESGASLEAEILASIQAILNTFEAQGQDQVASLAAAATAVDAARGTLGAQASTIAEIASRSGLTKAMSVGLAGIQVSNYFGSTVDASLEASRSVRPRVYDKRTNKLWSFDRIQTANSSYASTTVASLEGGATTVHYQSGQQATSTHQAMWMLPLAANNADPTLRIAAVTASDIRSTSGYAYSYDTFNVRCDLNWSNVVSIASANRPRGPWFAYDHQRKVLVYLANGGLNSNGTNGEPPSNAPVLELFADGSTSTIPAVVGWRGFLNYVGDASRFTRLLYHPISDPLSANWDTNANNYLIDNVDLRMPNRPKPTNRSAYPTAASTDTTGSDGSLVIRRATTNQFDLSRDLNDAYSTPSTETPGGPAALSGGLFTPMWVIETDGSVNIYRIYFSPRFTKEAWIAGTAANTSDTSAIIDGYDFVVVSNTGSVVMAGDATVDPVHRLGFYGNRYTTGRPVSAFWPLAVSLNDGVIQSFIGMDPTRTLPQGTASSPNTYGSQAAIIHQKLIR